MNYFDDGWPRYVSVADRKVEAAKIVARLKKAGEKVAPVIPREGRKLAHSFWGESWCRNIESYRDMDYRLERGRSYVRSHSVIDLLIKEKRVTARVNGSELYNVVIDFSCLKKRVWNNIVRRCSGEIDSVVELLSGELPKNVLKLVTEKGTGLFPSPDEIEFDCDCPDYATVCKHVAATLYGIGIRFDEAPDLFFRLRGVDYRELVAEASKNLAGSLPSSEDLSSDELSKLFGIEFDESLSIAKKEPSSSRSKKKQRVKKSKKKKKRRKKKA